MQLVAMASRVVDQHQHHFVAVFLLLAAWLGSQLQASAQQEYKSNTQGYSCSGSGTKSCNTFLLYRAQEKYSTVSQIAELFNTNATVVAQLNKLSAKQTLDMRKAVIIPVTCRCWANSISFANISYTIVDGDFYWDVNVNNFESLSTVSAIEAANSKLNPRGLQIGQKIVLPLRCACPSKAQTSEGVKSLVTYPVAQNDTVDAIASSFGVASTDIKNANTLMAANPRIIPETTLVIPINSSQPSYVYSPESPHPGDTLGDPSLGGGPSGQNKGTHIWIIVGVVLLAVLICLAVRTALQRVLSRKRERNERTEGATHLLGNSETPREPPCPARRDEGGPCSSH